MFYNWLNKGRSARSLRLTLQEREDQIRMDKLAAAWEQWRDRYKNERLRVVVSVVTDVRLVWHAYAHPRKAKWCFKLSEIFYFAPSAFGTQKHT